MVVLNWVTPCTTVLKITSETLLCALHSSAMAGKLRKLIPSVQKAVCRSKPQSNWAQHGNSFSRDVSRFTRGRGQIQVWPGGQEVRPLWSLRLPVIFTYAVEVKQKWPWKIGPYRWPSVHGNGEAFTITLSQAQLNPAWLVIGTKRPSPGSGASNYWSWPLI